MNVSVNAAMVTTAFELPGYRVARSMGLVRGVTRFPPIGVSSANFLVRWRKIAASVPFSSQQQENSVHTGNGRG